MTAATRSNYAERSILVIGDCTHREFVEPLQQMQRAARVRKVATVENAALELQRGDSPYLIVLAQARRGQFSNQDVARLGRISPLSNFVCLLGAWAEGEPRTGAPLNGVSRVYWHQWKLQMSREWLSPPALSRWAQPRTFTLADRSLLTQPIQNTQHAAIAVFASKHANYQALADAFSRDQFQTRWLHPRQDHADLSACDSLIWDAEQWDRFEANQMRRICAQLKPQRALVVLGWPRVEDIDEMRSIVSCDVLSKPYFAEDIAFWALANSKRIAA